MASHPSLLPESGRIYQEAKVRIVMRKDLLEGEVALLRASQKMKKEMDRAWEDFFDRNVPLDPAYKAGSRGTISMKLPYREALRQAQSRELYRTAPPCLPRPNAAGGELQKNPDKKEEDVWRRVEERLRTERNSKDQEKEV